MALSFGPLAGALGAEVSGIDLARPLDPTTKKELHEGWLRHQVLLFRDQDFTRDEHKAFARIQCRFRWRKNSLAMWDNP